MDMPTSFGYWVRRQRKALDLTQGDLARRIGCAAVTIQKIEAEERRPSAQIAELLAKHLRIPSSERAAFMQHARGEHADRPRAVTVQAAQAPTPVAAVSHNLPAQLTSFVGRTHELAAISSTLADARLLTLTGPGGTGKTRLALQLATTMHARFPDGVWLVELAPLADPALIPQTIATVLSMREEPGRPLLATLITHLRDKDMLLVLDNCEHLIDACAQLADTLLHADPQLRILASSREPLGIAGEAFFRVPALAAPDPSQLPPLDQLIQYEAVQLFAERARAVQPAFTVTNANAASLAQICARLDGIPLAIELAAARVRMLMVEQIAARLDDRFRLLTGGSRTALPRQQTLQALIDWSYDLLAEAERVLLRRLAVFVGGWTLEGAEAVCELSIENEELRKATYDHAVLNSQFSILDLLGHLVDKSLVQVEQGGVAARYRMLETIRQYALEKLAGSGEADAVRARHAEYYHAFSEVGAVRPQQAGLVSSAWFDHLAPEQENMRAALAWSQSVPAFWETTLRLATRLALFMFVRGYSNEARELESVLDASGSALVTDVHANAAYILGEIVALQGDYAQAQAQFERSLAIYRVLEDCQSEAWLLHRLGWLARERGDAPTAWARLAESLALYRALGHQAGTGWVLTTMAEVAILEEDAERAEQLLMESIALEPKSNMIYRQGWVLNHLGHAAQLRGDYDRVRQLHVDSLEWFGLFGDQHWGIAWRAHALGETALAQGDLSAAATWLAQALDVNRKIGDRAGIAWCLAGLGSVAVLDEEPERAARPWGAAEALRTAIGCRPAPAARATYERVVTMARAQLGEDRFAAAWAAGQALPFNQAIADALAGTAQMP